MDEMAKSLHCFLEQEVEASTILIIEEKGLPAIAVLSDGFLAEDVLDACEAGPMHGEQVLKRWIAPVFSPEWLPFRSASADPGVLKENPSEKARRAATPPH